MKKTRLYVFLFCLAALFFALSFQAFAALPNETKEDAYTLSVSISPKGGGSVLVKVNNKEHNGEKIKKGDSVTISATVKDDFLFDRWDVSKTIETLPESSLSNKEISFKMPAENIEIKGLLKENNTKYKVSIEVNDDSMGSPNFGHKSFYPGETVKIDAVSDEGFQFVRWTDTNGALTNLGLESGWEIKREISFTMPAKDVNLLLEFDYVTYYFTVKIEGEGEIEVIGKEKNENGKYECTVGEEIVLSATPKEDFLFRNWSSTNSAVFSDFDKTDTTLTCPASDFTLTVMFSEANKTLKMESGEGGSVFPEEGEMTVGVDTLVNLVATPDLGYKFSHWECSTEKGAFENEKKAETNFTMPDEDCTVKAVFKKGEYKLKFAASAGGKVEGAEGVYAMGEKISVKAIPLDGYVFSRWQCDVSGVVTSEKTSFEIVMPGEDIKVTAIFVLKTEAVPDVSKNNSNENDSSFPWWILVVVFLLSAIAIALVIIRDHYHLSYRYLIKKWLLKKNK